MEKFKTINKNATAEIVEKKSKFIANIFYVETIEEAEEYIKEIKKKYYDARHNCFAYAIRDSDGNLAIKYNDDGEPSGTAGAPMLKIMLEQNLENVLVIVTRYFGGILLGTGGLVRAYSDSMKKALESVEYVEKTEGYEVSIEVTYQELEKVKYYLKKNDIKIQKIEYLENVELIIETPKEKFEEITKINSENEFKIINSKILETKYVEI